MSLNGYDKVISAIHMYRNKQIDFHDFSGWVVPYATALQEELGYERKDFENTIENWFEYIEFCYLESDREKLTLALASFLETVIRDEPRPIVLPRDDRVIKDQIL